MENVVVSNSLDSFFCDTFWILLSLMLRVFN